jgi:hypothetical protein
LSAKLVPTFKDRECYVIIVKHSYGRILGFLDWSRYFFYIFYKWLLNCTHEAEWIPFQTHYLENLVAQGIEQGSTVSVAKNSGH